MQDRQPAPGGTQIPNENDEGAFHEFQEDDAVHLDESD